MSVAIDHDTDVSKEQYEERFETTTERTDRKDATYSAQTYCSTADCAICS